MAHKFNFGYIAHLSAWRKHKVEVQQEAATKAVAAAATAYAANRSLYNRLMLCNAVIDLIDDGDCIAEREVLMDELRCDEDGNPVNEDGEPIGQRASFGMHHPDSPSFGSKAA